jgi:hypothetical protein
MSGEAVVYFALDQETAATCPARWDPGGSIG